MRQKYRKNSCNVSQICRLGLPFGSHLLGWFPFRRVCLPSCFFGTSEGHPLDRFWPPLGHPWSDFLDFLINCRSSLVQVSKIPKQQLTPTTPAKTQASIQTNFTDNQSKQVILLPLMFNTTAYPKPQVLNK